METMDKREMVSAADLFALLDKEFRRRRTHASEHCFVSLPYPVRGARADGWDWQLVMQTTCERCTELLEQIVNEFRQRYGLRDKPAF